MVKDTDITDQVFGQLTAISRVGDSKKWKCSCSCGRETEVVIYALLSGNTKSCDCTRKINLPASTRTHGMSKTPEYLAWKHMKRRCDPDSNIPEYIEWYVNRGIIVCDEWQQDFVSFYNHIGPRPSPEHSVDRINNDGNYEPGNVRWAIPKVQANNRRCSILHTFNGITLNISDWAKLISADRHNLQDRLNKGWTLEESLTTPRWKPKGIYPIPQTILDYATNINRNSEAVSGNR